MSVLLSGDTKPFSERLIGEFEHPATYLWRACETALIKAFMEKHALASPILDVGCAEGIIARALFGPQDVVVGLDNCWELLSSARCVEPYRDRLLADACRLPFQDRTFPSVFSNCVIEHIPSLDNVLSEVQRVLQPGGLFMFTVPSASFSEQLFFSVLASKAGLRRAGHAYAAKRNKLLNHFHCYDLELWKKKLERKGMTFVDGVTYMPRRLLMLWDALAAYFFVAGRVPFLGKLQMRAARAVIRQKLLKHPALGTDAGGGALLIVARKGGHVL